MSMFGIELKGLTRNQKTLLAMMFEAKDFTATLEEIKAWGFNRTTIFSLQRRWLIKYNLKTGSYELNWLECPVYDAALKFSKWWIAEQAKWSKAA